MLGSSLGIERARLCVELPFGNSQREIAQFLREKKVVEPWLQIVWHQELGGLRMIATL
jgi:hypothetical protein